MRIPAIVHLGSRKTGTSSIQKFLALNRDRLLAQGVYWSDLLSLNQFELAYAATRGSGFEIYSANEGLSSKIRREAVIARGLAAPAAIAAAAADAGARTVVFSCEDFSVLPAWGIARVLEQLSAFFDVEAILCGLRRQDEYLVSNISTELKSGSVGDPSELFFQPRYDRVYRLDYAAMLGDWKSLCGSARFSVWLYAEAMREPGGVLGSFLTQIGVSRSPDFVLPAKENASVGADAQQALAAINLWAKQAGTDEANHIRRKAMHRLGNVAGRGYRPPRSVAAAVLERYAAANEALRREWFPERSAPLFGGDLADYPEQSPEAPLSLTAFFGLLAPAFPAS